MMLVVVDTNVLVSALITPFGNAARILDMVMSGELELLYDDRIIAEYREVLLRPKFSFNKTDVDALLSFIEADGIKITALPVNEPLIDEDDIPFIEVAMGALSIPSIKQTGVLITGNKQHFKGKPAKQVKIMTPDEFLKFWKREKK